MYCEMQFLDHGRFVSAFVESALVSDFFHAAMISRGDSKGSWTSRKVAGCQYTDGEGGNDLWIFPSSLSKVNNHHFGTYLIKILLSKQTSS